MPSTKKSRAEEAAAVDSTDGVHSSVRQYLEYPPAQKVVIPFPKYVIYGDSFFSSIITG